MSKDYVVHQGRVTEVKHVTGLCKTITYETVDNQHVANANGAYKCNINGQSIMTGEYYNYKDIFYPWVNGEFIKDNLKLNPNYET